MIFGSKLCPLECTQAKKLTDGCLVCLGRPHIGLTSQYPKSSPWASLGELKKKQQKKMEIII